MKQISMLEFRLHAEKIINQVQKGQCMILTRRGKAVARIVPIAPNALDADDPFYTLGELAGEQGASLSNDQIDDIIYGQ